MTAAFSSRRLDREARTLAAMIRLFCRLRHASPGTPCPACSVLLAYARERLRRCPFGEQKPTCASCPIHCYAADRRDRIREVMRVAGPRMPWRHPILALRHVLDGWRRPPGKTRRRGRP